MNRTLIGLLAAMIVLGVLAVFLGRQDAPAPTEGWQIDGFATPEQLKADRERGMLDPQVDMPSPIDEIEISRPTGDIRLVRVGDGPKPDWALTAPQKAPAVRFRVDNMVKLFKDETASIYSTPITPEERTLFDLEDERAIRVKVKAAGALWQGLDLVIGKVATAEEEVEGRTASKDTWVQLAGAPDVAYRIGGKDLRSPFEMPLKDLRDRRLFSLKPEELETLTVTPPGGQPIVLKGNRTETPAPKEGDPPKVEIAWSFAGDMGFGLDASASSTLARSFSNARAKDFHDETKIPKGALENPWKLEATATEGRTFTLQLGDGDGEEIWARVVGTGESATLDKHSAKGLRQTLSDLRDRTMVNTSIDAVKTMTFHSTEEGAVTVERDGEDWVFAGGPVKGRVDPGYHLKSALESKAKRYPRADEVEAAKAATRKPEYVAEVVTSTGTTRLGFGPKITEDPYKSAGWVEITDNGGDARWVLVQDATARRFRKGTKDLRWKRIFTYDKAQAKAIEIRGPGESNPTVKLTRGEDGKMTLEGTPEGRTVKSADLLGITTTLVSMSAKDFYPRLKAKKAGLVAGDAWSVHVTLGDGSTRELLISAKKEGGSSPHAVSKGGPLDGTVVSLNPFQADKLRKKLDDLLE